MQIGDNEVEFLEGPIEVVSGDKISFNANTESVLTIGFRFPTDNGLSF